MYEILAERLKPVKRELVDYTRSLIQHPSRSLEEETVARTVSDRMRVLGYDQVLIDDAGNVVGILWGRDTESALLLNSHMDTVAPHNEGQWSQSPFQGSVRDDRLYGLGAADCKGGLAAQLYAGALLKHSHLPFERTLVVAATVAEENGRTVGGRALVEKTLPELGVKPGFAVLGEPTNLGLYHGHDGWMELDILVKGPDPCDVHDAAYSITDYFDGQSSIQTEREAERLSVHPPRFINHGPPYAAIPLVRRLSEKEDSEGTVERVRQNAGLATRDQRSVTLDVNVREERQRLYSGITTLVRHLTTPWFMDPFHPLVARAYTALNSAGCKVRPGQWRLGRLGMGTAGSVFFNEFGLPTLGYGPGGETEAHACNEFVSIENLVGAVYGTAIIAHALIGVPVFGWSSDEI